MIRRSWKGALLAALTSAGVAWGQSNSPPRPAAPAPPAERVVTVQEKDGLPEQCRLLKTWTTKQGHKAYLLRSTANDEMLTVVQADGRSGGKQVGVQIYRWGNSKVAPEGAPVPPPDGGVGGNSGIRPVAHAVEAPAPPPVPSAPPPMPAPVLSAAACCGPATTACPQGGCDKGKEQCGYVHHYEPPPDITFKAGACVPVCTPDGSASYGYYPTQWRPWPGAVEVVPVGKARETHELLPAPKASSASGS